MNRELSRGPHTEGRAVSPSPYLGADCTLRPETERSG